VRGVARPQRPQRDFITFDGLADGLQLDGHALLVTRSGERVSMAVRGWWLLVGESGRPADSHQATTTNHQSQQYE
jgi:hypothetical protein